MNGWQERYWLLKQGRRVTEAGERRAEDFVCCEVPVGEDAAMALEIFTSREGAEAELWGMERLAAGEHYPRAANQYRERFTEGEPNETLSDRVVELAGYELVEMLDDSGIPYVLIDPSPVDEPIPEGLRIELAAAFAEELRRLLLGAMKKSRA